MPGGRTGVMMGFKDVDEEVREDHAMMQALDDAKRAEEEYRQVAAEQISYGKVAQALAGDYFSIYIVDPDTLEITNCNTVKIYATTTDEELKIAQFGRLGTLTYAGPPKRIENGDAFICMYGSGRSEEWEFYY